ncbi:MAG: metalloregulator ArsR/SmtB family transcription factor [Candidatus Eisenbacteria bacterium]|nr:metalloregulator ArsR/SmtB family transcription factor [Candidatus Latescibacterota bacterium]MBD3302556.1 metalloregulator ArsR/SmtB family transcription factor [Candidatus Eisenbacteria bacterium]
MKHTRDFQGAASLLKILGHPLRLKIVCGLLGEPANLTRIARDLQIPVSTAAQHLSVLRRGGVLEESKSGVEVTFRVTDDRVPAILQVLCSTSPAAGSLPSWSWRRLKADTPMTGAKS